jgi:signal peptidase I
MPKQSLTRTLAAVATVLVLGAAWFVLAPPQIGGNTRLVVTSGSSMAPKIHQGDLALVRRGGDPAVGDVILYHSHELHRSVLHRIVALDGNAFVMKGDNNDFRDAEHPTAGQVQGKLWIVVPGAGRVAAWLHQPANFAIILFLLVFGSLAGGREISRRRHGPAQRPLLPEKPSTPREPSDTVVAAARGAFVPAGIGLVLFSLLAFFAWSAPDVRESTRPGGYSHTGVFSYAAAVPRSTVYPTGHVATGDAAFVKLVRRLNVSFAYRLDSSLPSDVRGGIGLDARITDGTGWSRVVPITRVKPFDGPVARVDGVLDLNRFEAMGARLRDLTGSGTTTFTIALLPRVDVAGYAGSSVVNRVFAPELKFNLDAVALRLDAAGETPAELTPRLEGTTTVSQPSLLDLGPVSLPVSQTRVFAGLGIGATLLLLLGAAALLARSGARSEDERIKARYGSRIVRASTAIPDGRWISDVEDVDALVRIAQHYDRVILQTDDGNATTFLVDDGVTVYRFRAQAGKASSSQFAALPGS